ncbi:peptidoglycan-binding protein [Bacillus changyiensis]|uniref:peptidoglycan-binding protein n=1 Tax=Bacillus changyiensis TaxID=3004103 RepID=UPI0022E7C8D0|nr:peptidoglycan-binding protein [Bacillus changyiensis]MDA1477499.1 peptidoglycan-binding protein [Bacillus changyiensis]
MAVSLQALIDRSVRNMGSGIHPVVKETAIEVIKRSYKEGIYVQMTSGYRSFAEQNKLYAKGRTAPGKIVTNARAGQSNHNYGLAVDYVLLSSDGKTAIWTVNSKWKRVAQIAKALGFAWGGDWRSFKDYPHLEMMGGLTLSQLQAGKRPVLVSKVNNTTPAIPKPTKKQSLKRSSSSGGRAIVRTIQSTLNKRYKLNIKVDGYQGPETYKALLKGFQSELDKQFHAGLVVDGIWGPKTRAAVVNVRKGAKGNITWILQAMLICKGYDVNGLDSIFGHGLEKAVRAFQKANGLSVNGVTGRVTWTRLFV